MALDSAPIIYYLEGHPRHAARFAPLIAAAEDGRVRIVVSAITLAEVVAGPIAAGNEVLAARYRDALCESPGWRLVPIDADVAMLAARLRARHRLRLPDSIQLATALTAGASAFVTHDKGFARVRDLPILGLDDTR